MNNQAIGFQLKTGINVGIDNQGQNLLIIYKGPMCDIVIQIPKEHVKDFGNVIKQGVMQITSGILPAQTIPKVSQ